MKQPIHTIDEYKAISADIWGVFKHNFDAIDIDHLEKAIHDLQKKYGKNPRIYEFTCKLMKVYFDEIRELDANRKRFQDGKI